MHRDIPEANRGLHLPGMCFIDDREFGVRVECVPHRPPSSPIVSNRVQFRDSPDAETRLCLYMPSWLSTDESFDPYPNTGSS